MALFPLCTLTWALCLSVIVRATTTFLTFSDADCESLVQTLEGEESTASGECTKFRQQAFTSYSSFLLNTLGEGCSITIYGPDNGTDICSAADPIFADLNHCYDASEWEYYSVDECAASSSSTPITSSPTTTSVSTSTPSPNSGSSSTFNTGAIVGGAVSGVLGAILIILAALFFCWYRPRQRRKFGQGSFGPMGTSAGPVYEKTGTAGWGSSAYASLQSPATPSEVPAGSIHEMDSTPRIAEAPGHNSMAR
ncbi:hypothetical protein F4780DRAFT_781328 [Xylariomycetidae sp. FL0641]|nr:hypothetical protein F4780DRAFT_781328 [Xylariomycetidae sp. FL0641]